MKEGDTLEYIQIVKRTYGLESQNRMIAASIGTVSYTHLVIRDLPRV